MTSISVLEAPVEFRLLGRLEVLDGERQLALGGLRRRALLALLLLHRNETVSVDRIVDALWNGEPPRTAAQVIRVYVSHLRKELGTGGPDGQALVTHSNGYALALRRGDVDADRFEDLCTEGRALLGRGESEAAAERLAEALALWRGPPLAELAYEEFARPEIARLDELRLTALEDRFEALLDAGHDAELVADLERLSAEHPLRERLRAELMLALYRSGQQAAALEAYQQGRRRLVDDLGLEPGELLRSLHARMLRQEPGLAAARAWPTGPAPVARQPAGRRRRVASAAVAVVGLAVATGVAVHVVSSEGHARTTLPARRPLRVVLVNPYGPPAPGTEAPVVTDPVAGVRDAARSLPVQARIRWHGNIEQASRRADLVILGATPDPAVFVRVARAARRHPTTRFVVPEAVADDRATFHGLPNVTGIAFDDRELGYLAGYLAGLVVGPRQAVSAVGGVPTASVRRLIAGFREGAERARPGVRVLVDYTYDFVDQDLCELSADRQIDRGSRVVFDVAGSCGYGAMQAAGIRGVWGIGVDSDLSYLGPQILASAVKRLDRATELAIGLAVDGGLPAGGDIRLNLANDAVGLVGISSRVPASVRGRLEEVASLLRARDQAATP